jgi:hypothetical protein
MSFYTKDLDSIQCACAATNDAFWFMFNPTRAKYLRVAYQCEEAKDLGADVRQVVAVWIDQPLVELTKTPEEIAKVKVRRRSFLFVGVSIIDYSSDDKVDQFLALIDDGTGQMPSMRMN